MKRVLTLAALAAIGFAGAAYAGDVTVPEVSPFKTAQNATTAVAPKAMSDSELGKVTAAGQPTTLFRGLYQSSLVRGGTNIAAPGAGPWTASCAGTCPHPN